MRPSGSRARRVGRRRRRGVEFQLATTSDVAFLLLIFFITTAVFVSPYGLPLLLPPAGEAPTLVSERDLAVVEIDDAGRVTAGGRERTADELVEWAAALRRGRPETVFSLRIQAGCPYAGVVHAVDALRRAEVSRIAFALAGGA